MDRPEKTSTVNLKKLCPNACSAPFSELEYMRADPLNRNKPNITWWIGLNSEDCESRYEINVTQGTKKCFEIPGIPFKFVIMNHQIYYRRNVES